jgi:dCTP deaminase
MILTGLEIKRLLNNSIFISPWNQNQLGPNSYNLRLHNELLVYNNLTLDMKADNPTTKVIIPEKGLLLKPGILYLGRTVEYTKTIDLVPMLEGRSSIGRLGLYVHITAGFGDVGFSGYWTLEMSCIHPIIIYPNIEICQIFYHSILGNPSYYTGKYQDNHEVQPSLLFNEFNKLK